MQIRLHDMSLSESFPCTCIIMITHSELYVNFSKCKIFIQHAIRLHSRAFERKFIMSFMIKGMKKYLLIFLGNQVTFLGNQVTFSRKQVTFLGNHVTFSGNLVTFSGNWVTFSWFQIGFKLYDFTNSAGIDSSPTRIQWRRQKCNMFHL